MLTKWYVKQLRMGYFKDISLILCPLLITYFSSLTDIG